ncbi:alpha/beta hydrolase [Halanaerobium salsuginis]|jgi:acetyl esterase/lipase|uniref:Acetyl esterase/lipase n=1 Tax=Halanaerobium salsuginis TaxID=29563 RepID=A0A1I4HUR4_9FIRM|nr:alpha/beta hydrolase [Halanaerobium salsuginis]SFL45909.1 Acetyl esterase/lipase [Halanaerobium salsuginis]
MIDIWQNQVPGFKHNLTDPAPGLAKYLINQSDRPAILILPGGGYTHRADHEGQAVAEFFNSHGYNAFVLHYRVAPYRYPYPLIDALRAVKYIKAKTDIWQLKKNSLAVVGFSAGGHLAALVGSNNSKYRKVYSQCLKEDNFIADQIEAEDSLINALILGYPVITAGEFSHSGSIENLLGKNPDPGLLADFSIEANICLNTAPTFVWHTAADQSVPVENTLKLCCSLSNYNIEFASHIFPHGGHGLGLAKDNKLASQWQQLAINWLAEFL